MPSNARPTTAAEAWTADFDPPRQGLPLTSVAGEEISIGFSAKWTDESHEIPAIGGVSVTVSAFLGAPPLEIVQAGTTDDTGKATLTVKFTDAFAGVLYFQVGDGVWARFPQLQCNITAAKPVVTDPEKIAFYDWLEENKASVIFQGGLCYVTTEQRPYFGTTPAEAAQAAEAAKTSRN